MHPFTPLFALSAFLRSRVRRDERGQEVVSSLVYIFVAVVAILAVGVLMKQLGIDVMAYVRGQMGL